MNPELRDHVNAIGAGLAIIGGVCMFGMLFNIPDWITVTGLILWSSGIAILFANSRKKKD